ncbi:MAG: HAD-IIB family hydrolase [Candidatus Taylorbacteria bacterium]
MDISTKKLIVLDLQGTLTPSMSAISPEMSACIIKLLSKKKVAIISGSTFAQFHTQILNVLSPTEEYLSSLALLPTSGTRMYLWRGSWIERYAEHISPANKERIMTAIDKALRMSQYKKPTQVYGQLIEDRGSQITFHGLGSNAPLEAKSIWDPRRDIRNRIATIIQETIPEFDVRIAGMSSIDITTRGVNKAFGIRKLEEVFKVTGDDIVFVGDSLFHGGNDYPIRATGVDCISVHSPEETLKLLKSWV